MARGRGLEWLFRLQDRISGPAGRATRSLGMLRGALRRLGGEATGAGRVLAAIALPGAARAMRGLATAGQGAWSTLRGVASAGARIGVGVVAGAALALRAVARVGGEAESTRIAIAGIVNAAEGTGQRGFPRAMGLAGGVVDLIRRQAAALPGTEQDFIEIFRTALPSFAQSGERNLSRIADLSSRFGAVGIAQGVDAPQIGRDLNLLTGLTGRAGANVTMWRVMQGAIHDAARDMHLTVSSAQQFNRLRPDQRIELVRRAVGRFNPMIDAYQNTWDAISSTAKSHAQTLFRTASAPLFERLTAGARRLNEWFEANEAAALRLARVVGDRLGTGLDRVVAAGRRVPGLLAQARESRPGRALAGALGSAEGRSRLLATGAGVVGMLAGIPGLGILVGVVAELATNGPLMAQVWAQLTPLLTTAGGLFATLITGVSSLVAAALPGLLAGINMILPPLQQIFTALAPHLGPLGTALGNLLAQVGGLAATLLTQLMPVLPPLVQFLTQMVNAIARLVGWVNSILPGTSNNADEARRRFERGSNPISALIGLFSSSSGGGSGARAPTTGPLPSFTAQQAAALRSPGFAAAAARTLQVHSAPTLNFFGPTDPAAAAAAVDTASRDTGRELGADLFASLRGAT